MGTIIKEMTYQILHNEEELRRFYKLILEPHEGTPNLSFLIIPLVRKKYWDGLSSKQISIGSTTINTHKMTYELFRNKVAKYQIKLGEFYDNGNPIPDQTIAMYVTCNPLNERKSYFLLQSKMNQMIADHLNNPNNELTFDILKEYKSVLHANPLNINLKLDIDTKDPENIKQLSDILSKKEYYPTIIVETKNGFHYLIDPKCQSKEFYDFVRQNKDWVTVENRGGALIAIPGTYQADFPVIITS